MSTSDTSCVYVEGSKLILSTSLDEKSFGRTDLGKMIMEKGSIAFFHADGTAEYRQWQFDSTRTMPDGTVTFEGSAFEGNTLLSLFQAEADKTADSKETQSREIYALKALDEIIRKIDTTEAESDSKATLPGAEGIIVSPVSNNGECKVLVLPGKLFEQCAENSSSYGAFQGIFCHRGLDGIEAALFTRAAIAYRIATGKYAFTETSLEKRQADFTDSNFIPVEYEVNGIAQNLAEAINAGLCVKRKKRIIPGEKRFANEKKERERLEVMDKARALNAGLVEKSLTELSDAPQNKAGDASDCEFKSKREKFIKKHTRQVKLHRFYSQNNRRIWISAVAIAAALSFIINFGRENRKLATSTGLSSTQTVQLLFTGINNADVTIVQEIAKGKDSKALIQKLAGFFVTNKQRSALDEKNGTLTPAQWMFFKGKTDYWQYGVTDLKIDGKKYTPLSSYPRRMDKNKPLSEEDGRILEKGDETVRSVSYNLVHNDGETVIAVDSAEEEVTLKWNGTRWIVRSIKGASRSSSYKAKTYRQDYTDALESSGDDINQAAELMRQKYKFAPRQDDIMLAAPYMAEKYNNTAAKEMLK